MTTVKEYLTSSPQSIVEGNRDPSRRVLDSIYYPNPLERAFARISASLLLEFQIQMKKGKRLSSEKQASEETKRLNLLKQLQSSQLKRNPKLSNYEKIEFNCKNNPYRIDSVQFWIYEWVAASNSWLEAHSIASSEKMIPGLYDDNRTAAEHYIFARSFPNDEGGDWAAEAARYLYKGTGAAWNVGYQSVKSANDLVAKVFGSRLLPVSPASKVQFVWEMIGYWDQYESNPAKMFEIEPGVCTK
jgi:hypothetical protein